MAEFRSSAQSTGFNAITVPDNARRIQQDGIKKAADLRRVYEQTIAQEKDFLAQKIQSAEAIESQLNKNEKLDSDFRATYKQALRKRQGQKIAKLKKEQEMKQDVYKRLGTFSKGAMELGKELYEHHKEDRQAYGLALIMQTGVTAEELAELQRKEDDLAVEGAANNRTVERLKANGASAAEIKKIRDLDGWALYGAQKALAQQAKTSWYAFSNAPERRKQKYDVNGQQMSLEEAELAGLSSERANIIGQMKAEFFKPYSNYDLAFAEKYMFPGMREVDSINQQAYTTQLGKDLEKKERQQRVGELGTIFNGPTDPYAIQDYLNRQAPDGGPLLGAMRERMLDDLTQMAKDGLLDEGDLNVLTSQKFNINGKEVTFTEAFLKGKGRFSPTGQAFAAIQDIIRKSDVDKAQLKEAEAKVRRDEFVSDQIKTYNMLGRTLTIAEIEAAEKRWYEISGGKQLPEILKKLYANKQLGVGAERQYQAAASAADNGEFDTLYEIKRDYPFLSPDQVTAIARRGGIDPVTGRKTGETFDKKYYKPLEKALAQKAKSIGFINGTWQTETANIVIRERFDREFQLALADTKLKPGMAGNETSYIANKVMQDMIAEINDNKEDSLFYVKGVGYGAIFPNINSQERDVAPLLNKVLQDIDGDYERLLSTERLLGKDPNQDPDSLAGDLLLIGQTGRAPEWLLELSEETGIHWKTIANAQGQAYNVPTEFLIPLTRDEGMQEVIRPQFGLFLGRHPSPGTLQQASSQYQRTQSIVGLEVYRPILNLIASVESGNDTEHGGYDAMNLGGTNGGHTAIGSTVGTTHFGQPLMNFTLRDIIQLQNEGRLHAAGRYQFTKIALDDMQQRGWMPPTVSLDSPFNQETQDLLAIAYFRQSVQDITNSNGDLVLGLGQRWIGLQNLDPKEVRRIVKQIQNDPRYQTPGFQGYEVAPQFEAERQRIYGGSR